MRFWSKLFSILFLCAAYDARPEDATRALIFSLRFKGAPIKIATPEGGTMNLTDLEKRETYALRAFLREPQTVEVQIKSASGLFEVIRLRPGFPQDVKVPSTQLEFLKVDLGTRRIEDRITTGTCCVTCGSVTACGCAVEIPPCPPCCRGECC